MEVRPKDGDNMPQKSVELTLIELHLDVINGLANLG